LESPCVNGNGMTSPSGVGIPGPLAAAGGGRQVAVPS
jgi:hypothetical protein